MREDNCCGGILERDDVLAATFGLFCLFRRLESGLPPSAIGGVCSGLMCSEEGAAEEGFDCDGYLFMSDTSLDCTRGNIRRKSYTRCLKLILVNTKNFTVLFQDRGDEYNKLK